MNPEISKSGPEYSVETYYHSIDTVVRKYAENEDEFYELFQEGVVRAMDFLSNTTTTNPTTLLININRTIHEKFLQIKTKERKKLELLDRVIIAEPSDSNPFNTTLRKEFRRKLLEIIDIALNPHYLDFIKMHYGFYDPIGLGIKKPEIAEILGITLSAVHSKNKKLLQVLRHRIEHRPDLEDLRPRE